MNPIQRHKNEVRTPSGAYVRTVVPEFILVKVNLDQMKMDSRTGGWALPRMDIPALNPGTFIRALGNGRPDAVFSIMRGGITSQDYGLQVRVMPRRTTRSWTKEHRALRNMFFTPERWRVTNVECPVCFRVPGSLCKDRAYGRPRLRMHELRVQKWRHSLIKLDYLTADEYIRTALGEKFL